MPTQRYTLAELNTVAGDQFIDALAPVFEGPPWAAAAAESRRPFADLDALLAAFGDIVRAAPEERKVALLRAHPDLVGRAARAGALSAASRGEQASAGLGALTAEEMTTFQRLNAEYWARFDFPFVICARENTRESIVRAFEERLRHDRATEIAIALDEVLKIGALRLGDLVAREGGASDGP